MSSTTGTVRSALASPPAPVVSCPTHPHSSGSVSSTLRAVLPADPQLEQHDRGAVQRLVEVGGPHQAAGMPLLGQDPLGDSADDVQPLLVRVREHELLDRQQVPQAGEAVHQLGRVGRPAADDCDLHPLTPVRVTPSTKAFCAKKNRTTTGSITSTVAAITRFHCTWCSPRNEASPTATVQLLGSSLV